MCSREDFPSHAAWYRHVLPLPQSGCMLVLWCGRYCRNASGFELVLITLIFFSPSTGCSPYLAFPRPEPTVSGPNLEPASRGKSGDCLERDCGC